MPINLPPPSLNEDMFATCCETLPLNVKEQIASTYPFYFSPAFVFGDAPATPEPSKPALAKTKPAKVPSATIDKEALAKALITALERFPLLRSEDYVTKIEPSDYGATAETIMPAVKKTLEGLVNSKAAYCEGGGRGRRYWLAAAKTAEPEQSE